ncbi:MAG: hypothetical protein KIT17_03040 [Rubrivivax sp.]|nr:hypothetical protein [Rubrivivax sp.]
MWEKLGAALREFGAAAGLLYLIDRALRRLSPRTGLVVYELMCQPIDGRPLLPERMARHIEFREIERGHPDVDRMPARPEIKQARFDNGARCLGVQRKGVLLGYLWLSPGNYAEDEVRCVYALPVGGRAVFDFDLYLFPEHRMGTGFVALWHAANRYLHGLGVQASYSRMTRFNVASRRAHLRLGSLIVGRAFFVQLWRLEVMLASLRPYFALSWGARARGPLLRLPPLPAAGPVHPVPAGEEG